MSAPQCVTCGRPMSDQAYACTPCANRAAGHLRDVADLAPAARDVAMGQTRKGAPVSGGSGSGLELNLRAAARLDAIQNTLTTWSRHVSEERGIPITMEG